MQQVICEHPTLIVNRQLLSFIREGGCFYTTDNMATDLRFWKTPVCYGTTKQLQQSILSRLSKGFSSSKRRVEQDRSLLDSCYFVNVETGAICPIFVEVPCGHCVICQNRKRQSFAARCEAETQTHPYLPLFITLTYSDDYLPEDGHLKYDDVQDFLKRLRIRLAREYHVDGATLRYACCGEYTPTTSRPHYHIILWGLPYISDGKKARLFELVDKTWSIYDRKTDTYNLIGRTQVKSCFNSRGVGKYVGKYVGKSFTNGKDDEFLHCSTRHGGIGTLWIQQHKKYLLENNDNLVLKYTDRFTGQCKDMPMVKYFVNKVFPTVSMSVPQIVREAVGDFLIGINAMQQYEFGDDTTITDRYLQLFHDLNISLPDSLMLPPRETPLLDIVDCTELLDESLAVLARYSNSDYSQADYLANRRNEYFSRVSEQMPKVDVQKLADDIRKRLAKEKAKYVHC